MRFNKADTALVIIDPQNVNGRFKTGSPALPMKRRFQPILAQLRRDDCIIMCIGPFGSLSFVPIAIP